MTTFNRIELIDIKFSDLATNPDKRDEFVSMLNEFGKSGWKAYQMEQVGSGLLVFMRNEEA